MRSVVTATVWLVLASAAAVGQRETGLESRIAEFAEGTLALHQLPSAASASQRSVASGLSDLRQVMRAFAWSRQLTSALQAKESPVRSAFPKSLREEAAVISMRPSVKLPMGLRLGTQRTLARTAPGSSTMPHARGLDLSYRF
jgi:hypothetical protein